MKSLKLNIDGMNILLEIDKYVPSTRENWDSEWCYLNFSVSFHGFVYLESRDNPILLSCEIEELKDKIEDLLNGKVDKPETIRFIEPDFEFMVFPKADIRENPDYVYNMEGKEISDIYAEWHIYLVDNGVVSGNYISIALDRSDLTRIRDYLKLVEGILDEDSIEIKELIKSGCI